AVLLDHGAAQRLVVEPDRLVLRFELLDGDGGDGGDGGALADFGGDADEVLRGRVGRCGGHRSLLLGLAAAAGGRRGGRGVGRGLLAVARRLGGLLAARGRFLGLLLRALGLVALGGAPVQLG